MSVSPSLKFLRTNRNQKEECASFSRRGMGQRPCHHNNYKVVPQAMNTFFLWLVGSLKWSPIICTLHMHLSAATDPVCSCCHWKQWQFWLPLIVHFCKPIPVPWTVQTSSHPRTWARPKLPALHHGIWHMMARLWCESTVGQKHNSVFKSATNSLGVITWKTWIQKGSNLLDDVL